MLGLTLVKTASKKNAMVFTGLSCINNCSFQELMKEKDKLSKERDDQLQEITQVRNVICKISFPSCCMYTQVKKHS